MKEIEIDTKESTESTVKEKSFAREVVEWILCFVAAFVVAMIVYFPSGRFTNLNLPLLFVV